MESSTENFFIAWVFIPLARPQDIMASGSHILADSAPDTAIKQKPHEGGFNKEWLDAFMTNELSRIEEASLDIFQLKPGIA